MIDWNDLRFFLGVADGGSTLAAARTLGVSQTTVARRVTALEEAGLARRTPHPDDGRQLLVVLTEAGTRHVHETRRRRDAWLAEQLAALSPDDRAVLARAAALLQEIATR